MTRAELHELGYIVPIATVPSILQRGILSHRRAERVAHESIALQDVQDLRAKVIVPNGRPLHEYANMYICPRNPMLFKRKDSHEQICVVRVSADVVDLQNVLSPIAMLVASMCVSVQRHPDWRSLTENEHSLEIGSIQMISATSGATLLRNVQKC